MEKTKLLINSPHLIIAASLAIAVIFISNTAILQVQAVEQNNTISNTSKTPIDLATVIKQGEESVNAKLDKVSQALQSKDTSQAAQYVEQAKQDLYTLAVCATSALNSTYDQR